MYNYQLYKMECIHLITKRLCCEAALSPLKQLLYPPPPPTHTQKKYTLTLANVSQR